MNPGLTAAQEDALTHFAELVASSPHNLVSKQARTQLKRRHIPEGVALARALPGDATRLLDIGSGGGFPGLVISIVRPDLEVHLLDSVAKKTDFLSEASSILGLSVAVHTGRAEELASTELGDSFDLVTARAVAPLRRLLPWTIPFLRRHGLLYAVKGARWSEELADASQALRRSGSRVVATPDDGRINDGPPARCPAGSDPSDVDPKVIVIKRVS